MIKKYKIYVYPSNKSINLIIDTFLTERNVKL